MLTVDLQKLKKVRKQQMSLEQMSSKLGYSSPNGYYYLESGRSHITAETLAKVATILNVPIEEFFFDDGKPFNM
ncbi:MAG: helix-turn-helix domain-containing protein [Sporolactobacillus sp.]|jgi:transcriptional regulator with XRE-family HTH domain|nr:helix-turn-helix domain-containing protein [Sporolactobacillus sp.]